MSNWYNQSFNTLFNYDWVNNRRIAKIHFKRILKRIALIQGEWWIIDGEAHFADGDIGDFNHEAFAILHAQSLISDLEYDDTLDWESWTESRGNLLMHEIWEDDEIDGDTKCDLKQEYMHEGGSSFLINNLDRTEIDEDTFFVANGNHHDVRAFSMKEWGWKRMESNFINTWFLTQKDLDSIVGGIDNAYSDQIYDDEESGRGEPKFVIEVFANRDMYYGIPSSILIRGVKVTDLMDYRDITHK